MGAFSGRAAISRCLPFAVRIHPIRSIQTNERLEKAMVSFKEHTEVLSEARKDLHSIFRRLR